LLKVENESVSLGVAISFRGEYNRGSIFGLTTWTCLGNEAADDLFQTSIDPAPGMRAFF